MQAIQIHVHQNELIAKRYYLIRIKKLYFKYFGSFVLLLQLKKFACRQFFEQKGINLDTEKPRLNSNNESVMLNSTYLDIVEIYRLKNIKFKNLLIMLTRENRTF